MLSCGDDQPSGASDAGSDAASSGATPSGSTTAGATTSDSGTMSTGGSTSDAGTAGSGGVSDAGATPDASSDAGGGVSGGTSGPDAGRDGGSATFALTSPGHSDGAKFAPKYTCAEKGFNGSILPELNWTPGPAGTKSYAITFIDRTLADKGMINGYHWAIWNIPTSVMKLAEGMTNASTLMAKQTGAFLGPCPNFVGSGNTDNYEFTLYALKSETSNVMAGGQTTMQTQNAEKAFDMDNLGKITLKGSSDAKPPM
jgi:phosphatidylethanolamine-binding protein (PEBP) family uncharacterized protein